MRLDYGNLIFFGQVPSWLVKNYPAVSSLHLFNFCVPVSVPPQGFIVLCGAYLMRAVALPLGPIEGQVMRVKMSIGEY